MGDTALLEPVATKPVDARMNHWLGLMGKYRIVKEVKQPLRRNTQNIAYMNKSTEGPSSIHTFIFSFVYSFIHYDICNGTTRA